ncbi:hypothetical protein [Shewanella waksmanii]
MKSSVDAVEAFDSMDAVAERPRMGSQRAEQVSTHSSPGRRHHAR